MKKLKIFAIIVLALGLILGAKPHNKIPKGQLKKALHGESVSISVD